MISKIANTSRIRSHRLVELACATLLLYARMYAGAGTKAVVHELKPGPGTVVRTINSRGEASTNTYPPGTSVMSVVKGDSLLETFAINPNDEVKIIVQFTNPPLAAYRKHRRPVDLAKIRDALNAMQSERQQFFVDLGRAEAAGLQTHKGHYLSGETRVRFTFNVAVNGFALTTRRWLAREIRKLPRVRHVSEDQQVRIVDEISNEVIKADSFWTATGMKGEGEIIGIIDTGIDYFHEALGGAAFPNTKVIGGYDFVNNDADPMDDHGHGTHVAGIAAGDGPPPVNLQGVAPKAKLMAFKVLDQNGSGSSSQIIAGIERALDPDGNPATDDAVDVISMSLGGRGDPNDAMSQAVDNAVDAGVLCVIAAGNSANYQTIGSPGNARRALTVGATDNSDVIASFSSRGPSNLIYGLKPDVTAPGVSVTSAKMGGGYIAYSGTSMATPHVAGAAALLLQLHPAWPPGEVKAALMESARDLGYDVWTQGHGRIDLAAARRAIAEATPASISYGLIDDTQTIWSRTDTVTLHNYSTTAAQSFIISTTPLPDGISAVVTPSTVTVPQNGTSTFTFTLSINNGVFPFLTASPPSFDGRIVVQNTSASNQFTIPFAFLKSPSLLLAFDGAQDFVEAHDRTSRLWYDFWKDTVQFLLPPGTYDVLAANAASQFLVREGVSVTGRTALAIHDAEEKNLVTLVPVDATGNPVPPTPLVEELYHKASGIGVTFIVGSENINQLKLSDLSSSYSLDLILREFSDATHWDTYEIPFQIADGVSSSFSLQNDRSRFKRVNYLYSASPDSKNLFYYQFTSQVFRFSGGTVSFGVDAWGYDGTAHRTLYPPYARTAYYLPTPSETFGWKYCQQVVYLDDTLAYACPFVTVNHLDTLQDFDFADFDTPAFATRAGTHDEKVGAGPTRWAGRLTNSAATISIGSDPPLAGRDFLSPYGDIPFANLPYKLFSNGTLVQTGTFTNVSSRDRSTDDIAVNPGQYELQVSFDKYYVRGTRGTATARLNFNTTFPDKNPPYLKSLLLTSNGALTDTLDPGAQNVIECNIRDDVRVSTVQYFLRSLSCSLWIPLPVDIQGDNYHAQLPATLASGLWSLRILASDPSHNTTDYTIEPAFAVTGASVVPMISLSGRSISYGNTLIGSPKNDSVIVANEGTATLNVASVNSDNDQFRVSPSTASVVPCATKAFIVTFAPTSPGMNLAKVVITHNASNVRDTIYLAGTGVAPAFSAAPANLLYGNVLVGSMKRDSLTVTNPGTATLHISSVTSDNVQFAVTPTGAALAPSAGQKFYISFSPSVGGGASGKIIFNHDAGGGHDTVSVDGAGATPAFIVTPPAIAFGTVPVGGTKKDSATVTNPGTATLHISSVTSDNARFAVTPAGTALAPSAGQKFYITFSPAVDGGASGKIIFNHDAGGGHDTLWVAGTSGLTRHIAVAEGWNLLSVPLTVDNYSTIKLFPTAISKAFGYRHSYSARDTLVNGQGFWLKFGAVQDFAFEGPAIINDTIDVMQGWNLIGSSSSPVATATITSQPGGIKVSPIFAYAGGYSIADTMRPGQGYWIKVYQSGKLILAQNGVNTGTSRIQILSGGEVPPSPPVDPFTSSKKVFPEGFALAPNYPNPFNPTSSIVFQLPVASSVTLKVFSLVGEEVLTLVDERLEAGSYETKFDGTRLSTGVYFYRLEAQEVNGNRFFAKTMKMIYLR